MQNNRIMELVINFSDNICGYSLREFHDQIISNKHKLKCIFSLSIICIDIGCIYLKKKEALFLNR